MAAERVEESIQSGILGMDPLGGKPRKVIVKLYTSDRKLINPPVVMPEVQRVKGLPSNYRIITEDGVVRFPPVI